MQEMMQEMTKEENGAEESSVKEKVEIRYAYPGGKVDMSQNRRIAIIFTVLLSVLFWMTGSYVCVGIGKDYIFLSWITCLPALIGCWLGVIKLFLCRGSLTEKDVKKGPGRMWRSSFIVAVASGVAFLGSLYFLFQGTYTSFAIEMGLVIRLGILCACSVLSIFCNKKYESSLVEINS